MAEVHQHRQLQSVAKAVLASVGASITAADTERVIAGRAASMLADHGITETWYYDCPALVLLGSSSCLSISGREYQPSDEKVGATNLVTVDLSPCRDGIWADCARSFFIEGGKSVEVPSTEQFVRGAEVQKLLHASVLSFVKPATTLHQLFEFANRLITAAGFENLDFRGNVGHTIESNLSERRYIEHGNNERFDRIELFTFEPHIRAVGGTWGFKHENIYYLSAEGLQEL